MPKSKKITFIVNHAAYLVSHRLKIVEKLIRDGWNCQIMEKQAVKLWRKTLIEY